MPNSDLRKSFIQSDLSSFFEAQSVAVIGLLKEGIFGGYVVIKSLLDSGYAGQIYPINPAYKEVLGLRVYSALREVRRKIDLVLIMINSRTVPQVIKECAENGVKAVIVISDGFAERDQEGVRLQNEIVHIARQGGIRIIGPNTAGIANASNGLNLCAYESGYHKLREGPVAICSQPGMTNPQAFPYPDLRFGVSKICDFGNKCDIGECDMLEYVKEDSKTSVISMHLENIEDGRRFLEISKRVASQKPVLILKSGRTQEGARVSASHTGSLAINDQIFDAACKQAGILRLEKFGDLFELPKIFASQPLPRGNRLAIISYTGGAGVLATDEGAKYGLFVTKLAPETAEMLDGIFPGLGKIPVDIGPPSVAIKDFYALYPEILNAVMSDENVDSLFNVLWVDVKGKMIKAYVESYEQLKGHFQKPLVTWIGGPDSSIIAELTQRLEELGFPVFRDLETSIKALAMALRFTNIKKRVTP